MAFKYIARKASLIKENAQFFDLMTSPSRIKLITFDAYHTLFKPKGSLSAQYVEEAAKFGYKVTKEAVHQSFGNAWKAQVKKAPFYGLNHGMTAEAWWRELVYSTYTLSGVEPKELDKNYDQLFTSVYNRFNAGDAYTIFPDVLPTLEELKNQGFRMGVISNADERLATIIDNLELGKYFDFVLASADVGVVKPNKAIYDKALKAAGREVKPQEALHVGDDVETDYFGALKAGWNSVLLERATPSVEDFSPAMLADLSMTKDHRPKEILTLHDLLPFLKNIEEASTRERDDINNPSLKESKIAQASN